MKNSGFQKINKLMRPRDALVNNDLVIYGLGVFTLIACNVAYAVLLFRWILDKFSVVFVVFWVFIALAAFSMQIITFILDPGVSFMIQKV